MRRLGFEYFSDAQYEELEQLVAAAAAREPVTVVVGRKDAGPCRQRLASVPRVSFLELDHVNWWLRDVGPSFVRAPAAASGAAGTNDPTGAVHWEFHGYDSPKQSAGRRSWYGLYRQKGAAWRTGCELDASLSRELARHGGAVANIGQPRAGLAFEGGAVVCDGQGTGVVLEEILPRSGAASREDLEAQLRRTLGLQKLIWLPYGLTLAKDGGNAHADMVVAFCGPGRLLLSVAARGDDGSSEAARMRANQDALLDATDACGRPIEVIPLPLAEVSWWDRFVQRQDLARGQWYGTWLERTYANLMFVSDAVLVPQFGDARADAEALQVIGEAAAAGGLALEPVPVQLREISKLAGGLRCLSLPVPR